MLEIRLIGAVSPGSGLSPAGDRTSIIDMLLATLDLEGYLEVRYADAQGPD